MKIYDALIIGSCYRALGYALTKGNSVIVEEREMCDTQLCVPIYSFERDKEEPTTELGKSLNSCFEKLSLYKGNMQNTTALEMGFCKLAIDRSAKILLKCRVVSSELSDGYFDVKTISGEGISHLFARKIIDMRPSGDEKSLALIVTVTNDGDISELQKAFPDAKIEPAFYSNRYAIHCPALRGEDRLSAAERVYSAFLECKTDAKLIHVADILTQSSSDVDFGGPIGALEEGIRLAQEDVL